jgi:hypothetical protein
VQRDLTGDERQVPAHDVQEQLWRVLPDLNPKTKRPTDFRCSSSEPNLLPFTWNLLHVQAQLPQLLEPCTSDTATSDFPHFSNFRNFPHSNERL